MEEKTPNSTPDLTYRTNRGWVIKTALLWTCLMVPSQIAQVVGRPDMDFILTLLGMVGFCILLVRGLTAIVGKVSLREFQELKLGYPWALLLGIMAWHLTTSMAVFFLLMGAFEPQFVVGGDVEGAPR